MLSLIHRCSNFLTHICVCIDFSAGHEVLPHRMGIVGKHGDTDKQGFMVAFFKSLEPLSTKIPEIRHRSTNDAAAASRKKRAANSRGYWDDPNCTYHTYYNY